jgi:hypothetical protein
MFTGLYLLKPGFELALVAHFHREEFSMENISRFTFFQFLVRSMRVVSLAPALDPHMDGTFNLSLPLNLPPNLHGALWASSSPGPLTMIL